MVDGEALQVTQLVTRVLDSLDIRYVIGGSMASIVHGMIRTTMDVDIVADLNAEQVESFISGLQGVFYIDEQMILQAVQRRSSFNLIHLQSMFKVDIFIPKERPFDQQQLNRRVSEQIGDSPDDRLWVLTAEDIILAKLDWFRLGGGVSERQWRDILGVIKTQQATLNMAYLNQWANSLGVSNLLSLALQELDVS